MALAGAHRDREAWLVAAAAHRSVADEDGLRRCLAEADALPRGPYRAGHRGALAHDLHTWIDADQPVDHAVFVGGAGRSGTTLLRAMLHAHPRLHAGPELKILPHTGAFVDRLVSHGDALAHAGLPVDDVVSSFDAFVRSVVQAVPTAGLRLVEKTPANVIHMLHLARCFPASRFLHLLRDGRDVVASLLHAAWVHPGANGLLSVPNYRMIVASQTGRVIRIVPEFPAVVMAYYDPQDPAYDPTQWQLRWQELNLIDGPRFSGGRDWFSFGPRYPFDEVQVRGVGVQRLGRNADRFGFTWAGYLVYVIRRDLATQMDSVDFYLFDYHQADAARSVVLLQGNAPFTTRTDGPGASIGVEYPNVGDDESYEDPDGAACVAISGVRRKLPTRDGFGNLRLLPSGDPNVDPGVICVLTIRGPTPSDWRLDTLTPATLAVAPRKDPEAIMVGTGPDTKMFIFNREFDVTTQTWRLHRTLAWEAP